MQRIAILGSSGAGKSTLARSLSEKLDLSIIHLDQLFWQPGWVEGDQSVLRDRIEQETSAQAWIIDGNYASHFDVTLARVDTILFLDYPTRVCLARALKRIVTTYGVVRGDMAPGCPERFDFEFLLYIWRFRKDIRPRIVHAVKDRERGVRLIRFVKPQQTEAWLHNVRTKTVH